MIFATLGTLGTAITIPGTIELALVTGAAWLPKREQALRTKRVGRIAVVVPAHNEEKLVARAIRSLLQCEAPLAGFDVFVIADNCSDATARIAVETGALVLERNDRENRGKGYALDFAFTELLQRKDADNNDLYGAFLVVDADTDVATNFVVACERVFAEGADGVQTPYFVRNALDGARTQFAQVATYAFNLVRPRGRERLGLSVGILGNGFGLTRETLEAVPYKARSVVEDLEYHLLLVEQGRRIRFVEDTHVLGDMPSADDASQTQRARWEGGRYKMMREHLPRLIGRVLRGDRTLWEPTLELSLLPLSNHVSALAGLLLVPFPPSQLYAATGLIVVGAHVATAMHMGGASRSDWQTLMQAPRYILNKARALPSLLRASRNEEWVRTAR